MHVKLMRSDRMISINIGIVRCKLTQVLLKVLGLYPRLEYSQTRG